MNKIPTTKVSVKQESRWHEIEVYVAFHKSGGVFVNAGVSGAQLATHQPQGDIVKRYIFDVEVPIFTKEEKL